MPRFGSSTPAHREPVAAKVPEITALFWLIKVLTTGMGEAMSDYLGRVNLVLAGVAGAGGFVLALRLQFCADRYVAWRYWFAVMMVAVFGTMAADGLHVGLGIPYAATTILYALAVAVVFALWYRSQGTLSIHSITTRRRERYYWITVFATFALGTAAGDLTATSMTLGYLGSAVLFAAIIVVPLAGWRCFGLNPIVAFWFAYIVTRPLGASLADWPGKPSGNGGGLGLGDGVVAGAATVLIALAVAYLSRTRSDVQDPTGHRTANNTRLAAPATKQ